MKLPFSKMQALGNDFMVIDGVQQTLTLSPALIRQWADREQGVGFDQLLLIEASQHAEYDFFYRIFNADGSEVGQCGNGARCVAKFIQEKKLSAKTQVQLKTITTQLSTELLTDGQVSVNLGAPNFSPAAIPCHAAQFQERYSLIIDEMLIEFGAVSVGNPHAVIVVKNIDDIPINTIGASLAQHEFFPLQTNVEFMQIIMPDVIKLRVYERGAGETLACGSGAASAVAMGKHWRLLADQVRVQLPGGDLQVQWGGGEQDLLLMGPAEFEFDGEVEY